MLFEKWKIQIQDGKIMIDLKIHVKVAELLKHLAKNKAAHIKSYESALKVYFKKLNTELANMTNDAAACTMRKDNYLIHIAILQIKSKEYDRCLKIVKNSVEDLVEFSTT